MATEHLFHLALVADWEAAQAVGDYRVSTLGVSLEQEGFLHASFAHQWEGVRERYYADVADPLVLLEIDPDLLDVPLVVETPEGSDESFPHIYGPLPVVAVVGVRPAPHAADVGGGPDPSLTVGVGRCQSGQDRAALPCAACWPLARLSPFG